jgi:hypothetical protein
MTSGETSPGSHELKTRKSVARGAVKGQVERQRTASLTALHATGRSVVDVGEKKYGAATSALTFMTFS